MKIQAVSDLGQLFGQLNKSAIW